MAPERGAMCMFTLAVYGRIITVVRKRTSTLIRHTHSLMCVWMGAATVDTGASNTALSAIATYGAVANHSSAVRIFTETHEVRFTQFF